MTLSYVLPAVTVEEADAYAALRVWSNWTGEDPSKEGALRRSQDFIAAVYNSRWAEEWENDEAPEEVKYAIIEGARRELVSPGSLNPDVVLATVRKRVKVEGAVEVEYAVGSGRLSADDMRPDIRIIEQLLAGFLRTGSGGVTVNTLRV
jgi:hypothetical protein